MTDIKRIASADLVGFCLELQQAVQEGYQILFDNAICHVQIGTLLTCGVAKKSKKKTTKIVPCGYHPEFGYDLSDREQQLKTECAEFTNNEYLEYKKLRKKSNYLKSKLVNTVSKGFTLD